MAVGRVGLIGRTGLVAGVKGSTAAPVIQPITLRTAPNYYAISQSSAVGSTRGYIARRPIYIGRGGASELRASFHNTFATRGAESGNSVTVRSLYLEKGDGSTSVQMTFDAGAATSKTLAWLDSDVQSDAILPSAFGLTEFAEYSLWWERIVFDVPLTTDKYPSSVPVRTNYTGFTAYRYDPASFPSQSASGTGALDGAGKTAIANGTKVWGAIWLGRATVAARAYLNRGDSWTRDSDVEAGTYTFPLRLFADIFERALVNEAGTQFEAFLNCGVYGSGLSNYNGAADPCVAYYKYATDFHDEYGRNDTAISGGTAGMQAKLTALWANYAAQSPGCRIWRTKLLAPTTSSDTWATEANQTVPAVSQSGGFDYVLNDWFDTKRADGTLAGILPLGRMRGVSSFYKWRTSDGVANWSIASNHPSPYAGVPLCAAEGRTILLGNPSAVPGAISALTLSASDTTITATWADPGGSPSDYLVEISPAGAGSWTGLHTYDPALACCWTGLTPSTAYDVRVTPINCKGPAASPTTGSISTTAAPSSLVLDGLSTVAASYIGTRRVKASYSGACMYVHRSIDKAETAIWFNAAGDLDTAFLTAWSLGGDVQVKRMEDLSGAGKSFSAIYTSFTLIQRPYIVVGGAVQTVNGKPTPRYDQASPGRQFPVSALSASPTQRSVVAVVRVDTVAATRSILGGTTGGFGLTLTNTGRPLISKLSTTNVLVATNPLTAGVAAQISFNYTPASGAAAGWLNGAANGTATSAQTLTAGNASLGSTAVGGNTGAFAWADYIPEIGIFDAAILSTGDRQTLEASQKAYWGTP